MTLHPNPASGILHIENLKEGSTVKIYNTLGQLVLTGDKGLTIDVSNLDSGLYLLTTTNGNKKETLKFIKEQ
ncbi:MAG: T9SS type A sorting domain-containing protein [Flavobacteriaceae bacterium]